jgi:hypothetical protein
VERAESSKLNPPHLAASALKASWVYVLGQRYISSIEFDNTGMCDSRDSQLIPIQDLEIKGLRFTVGMYGIRAISILYDDGSTSPWAGDTTSGWTGVMYGESLKILRVLKDVRFLLCCHGFLPRSYSDMS